MYLVTTDSFLAIVQAKRKGSHLLVRGVFPGDIEQLFPKAKVSETVGSPYRFRAEIKRAEVAKVIAQQVSAVDYGNFKDTIDDPDRHSAYMNVWAAMRRAQDSMLHLDTMEDREGLAFADIDEDEDEDE